MRISFIGIDLSNYFHLVALDAHSKVVIRQKFTRKQMLAYTGEPLQQSVFQCLVADEGSSIINDTTL